MKRRDGREEAVLKKMVSSSQRRIYKWSGEVSRARTCTVFKVMIRILVLTPRAMRGIEGF